METGKLLGAVKTVTEDEFMMVYTDEWTYLKHRCGNESNPVRFYPIEPDAACRNCSKRVPKGLWALYSFYICTYIQIDLNP